MPEIVVRPVEPEDLDGYLDVRALTFNDGNPIPEDRRAIKQPAHYARYAARLDGEVHGIFNLLDLTSTRGEATLACAGVASVAVSPHRRRSGLGAAMMSWIPRHLRDSGVPLSSLYAYREPFYRRFGWEVAGHRFRISCPSHRLPKVSSDLPVHRLGPANWELIDPCYTDFAHARSGLCLRTPRLWERVLGENRPLTVYAAGDPVEAYAVVSHSATFWTTDHISDVAWCSARGYEALLGIFGAIGINKTGLTWFEPSDSPFYATYLDQGIEARLDRPIMFRVCDAPGALRGLRAASTGSFTIHVRDELIPENEGPWRVDFSPAGVDVSPASTADVSLDIRQFTQAFLGEPSLLDLARLGLIRIASLAGLASAANLLPALPVICNDFF
jgi:predicted acetyltransferase